MELVGDEEAYIEAECVTRWAGCLMVDAKLLMHICTYIQAIDDDG